MDQRQTFAGYAELMKILKSVFDQGKPTALLIDRDGLTRMRGRIIAIQDENTGNPAVLIDTTPQATVSLSEIIAVDGIFRSDYSEC